MGDVTTSDCECPYCQRPIEIEWCWSVVPPRAVGPNSGEVVDDGTGTLKIPRYPRRVECPACGNAVVVEHELVPRFFAHFDDEEREDDGDE